MLLLVLILVLIAFGLLVVALLTGSVLWAWVSVGVSVGAAAVLLVDWLQRRSAVKVGPESATEPTRAPGTMSDIEPVTEILAVVAPAGARGPGSVSGPSPATSPEPRRDAVPDAQQTVVMPVVQPSGSPTRPPGAQSDITSSSVISSPSVTTFDSDRLASPPAATAPDTSADPDATVFAPAPTDVRRDRERRPEGRVPGGPEDTVMVDIRKGSTAQGSTAAPVDATVPSTPAYVATSEADRAQAAAGATAVAPDETVVVSVPTAPPTSAPPTSAPPASAPPASDSVTSDSVASDSVTSDPVTSDPVASDFVASGSSGTSEEAAVAPDGRGGAAPDVPDVPAAGSGVLAGGSSVGGAAEVAEPDGEAPEEPHDPAAAALVAGLDDDVVVIDEHPRYHVAGCRALAKAQVIPLPAREAVELGFTPCGWCSPDRTLAGRHPAPAR